MANIVREDLVLITYQTDIGGLRQADDALNKLRQNTQNVSGLDKMRKGFNNLRQSLRGVATDNSLGTVNNSVNKLSQSLRGIGNANHLKKLTADIEYGGAVIDTMKGKVKSLNSTIKGITTHPFKSLNKAILPIQMSVGRTIAQFKRLASQNFGTVTARARGLVTTLTAGEKGGRGFVNALKSIGKISVTNVSTGLNRIVTSIRNGISPAGSLFSALKRIGNVSMEKTASGLKSITSGLGRGLVTAGKMGVGALAAGTAAIGGLIGKGISYNNQMQSYTTSFETLLGSAEKANKMVADLKQMADTTPFEMTDMSSAAQTLMSFGVEANKVMPSLKALGDVSMGNAERFSNLSLAFAQVQAAGKLTGQDLLQFVNAGFNPLQVMAEKTGKSMAELREEMSKGAISADMVSQAFQDATSKGGRFYQAMEKHSKTFAGQMSTIKDNANSLLGTLTQGIQKDLAETLLPKVNDQLTKLNEAFKSGGLDGFLKALPAATETMFVDIAGKISAGLPTLMTVVTTMLNSLVAGIAAVLPQLVTSLATGLLQLLQGLLNTLQQFGSQIMTALVSGFYQVMMGLWQLLPQFLQVGIQLVIALAQGVMQYVPMFLQQLPQIIVQAVQVLTSNLPLLIETGVQLVVNLAVGIIQAIPYILAAIPQIIQAIWDGFSAVDWGGVGKTIIDGIGNAIKGLGSSLWSTIKGVFTGEDSGGVKSSGLDMGNSYASGISQSKPQVSTAFQGLTQGLTINNSASMTTSGTQSGNAFATGITQAQPQVNTAFQGLTQGITTNNTQNVSTAGTQAVTAFSTGITQSQPQVDTAFTGLTQNMTMNNTQSMTTAGTQAGQSFSTGITQSKPQVDAAIRSLTQNAGASSSITMTAAGRQVGMAFAMGIRQNRATVIAAVNSLIQGFVPNTGGMRAAGVQTGNAYASGIRSTKGVVVAAANSLMVGLFKDNGMARAAGVRLGTQFATGISSTKGKAVATARSTVQGVKAAVTGINLAPQGAAMMSGLAAGIRSGGSSAIAAARSIANAINAEFARIQKINSPSKVWMGFGKFQMEGLKLGMEKGLPKVQNTVGKVSQETKPNTGEYTPYNSSSVSNSRNAEYNSYAPQFNLTISGSNDDRILARKVKRWVEESVNDTFKSMERKSMRLREV